MGEHNNAMCDFFSRADICADFWNGVLFHGRQEIKPEELEYSDKEYYPVAQKKKTTRKRISERRRDVLMKRRGGEQGDILLGIELMDTIDYTMPVRKLVYDAQEYQRQMRSMIQRNRMEAKKVAEQNKQNNKSEREQYWKNSGEFLYGLHKGDKIPPLITVALYCGNEKYDGCNDLLDMLKSEQMDAEYKTWIIGYPLHVIVLQDLNEEYFQTGLRELIGVLKRSADKHALLVYYGKNQERFAKLDDFTIETIGIMIGNKKLIDYKHEQGGLDMCKAFEDAKIEGKIEGKQEGLRNSIQNLMKNLQMTAEQAMEALGIPQGEREIYLKQI